jgi:hypothetical protein
MLRGRNGTLEWGLRWPKSTTRGAGGAPLGPTRPRRAGLVHAAHTAMDPRIVHCTAAILVLIGELPASAASYELTADPAIANYKRPHILEGP